jgi:hypothetical protein
MSNVVQWSGQMQPGTRDGNWVWNGSQWVCSPDCGTDGSCPPFGPPVFSGPVNQPPWYPGANGGVSFGATAPPNPVRGHMWWDGTAFWLFDGAAWVQIGGAGAGGTSLGTTAPANPVPGQQWFNGSVLYIWDGNAWVPTSTTKSYIQPTAPPAPNPGDTWFDGTQMRIWTGTAWALVGPGATVGPVATTTEVFSMPMPAPISLAASPGVLVIVPFTASPTIDTQSAYNATTHAITPKTPGYYFFNINAYVSMTATGIVGVVLAKNDPGSITGTTAIAVAAVVNSPGSLQSNVQGAGIIKMNGTTDYVRLFADSSGASTINAASWPIIDGVLLP